MLNPIREVLKRLRGQSASPETPLGLSEAQLAKLRSLRNDEGFLTLVDAIDRLVKLHAEQLLAPSAPTDTLHFMRGQIAGLRKAATLADEILQTLDAAQNARERLTQQHSDDARALLFGHPGFRESLFNR